MAKKKTPAAQAQGNKVTSFSLGFSSSLIRIRVLQEAAKIETPGADVVPNQSPQPAVEEDEPVKVNNGSLQEMRYAVGTSS